MENKATKNKIPIAVEETFSLQINNCPTSFLAIFKILSECLIQY
jgi:ribosomal protein L23